MVLFLPSIGLTNLKGKQVADSTALSSKQLINQLIGFHFLLFPKIVFQQLFLEIRFLNIIAEICALFVFWYSVISVEVKLVILVNLKSVEWSEKLESELIQF